IDAARGDLILWTDDDVLTDPDWIAEYVRAAETWPAASFFGGTIEPWFQATPPRWVRRHLGHQDVQGLLAVRGPFEAGALVVPERLPFGANMAMRRSVFSLGRFDNRLSLKKNEQVRGEEVRLFRQLF